MILEYVVVMEIITLLIFWCNFLQYESTIVVFDLILDYVVMELLLYMFLFGLFGVMFRTK